MGDLLGSVLILVILVVIMIIIIGNIQQWLKDNSSPKITTSCKVISKRTKISSMNFTHMNTTSYYIIFELENGSRAEFKVSGHEYGILVPQDKGILTCQGSRYLSFKR